MASWRDRLCGSIVLSQEDDEAIESLRQFIRPNQTISCGGVYIPGNEGQRRVPGNTNFVLPTDAYSVLVFKEDGSAVIYSDDETRANSDEAPLPAEARK